jgi:hypothetical protein
MKALLVILLRKYHFELPNGPDMVVKTVASITVRPNVYGEPGFAVPIRVSSIF